MAERVEPLLAWALGGFHAAVLMVLLALLLHVAGTFGGFLASLSTALGLVVYLLLWAVMWAIAQWVTRDVAWTADGPAEQEVLLNGAIFAGGALGAGVLVVAVLVTAVPFAAQQGIGALAGSLFFALVGGGFAFVFGAIVGGALSTLDLALLRVARRMLHD